MTTVTFFDDDDITTIDRITDVPLADDAGPPPLPATWDGPHVGLRHDAKDHVADGRMKIDVRDLKEACRTSRFARAYAVLG